MPVGAEPEVDGAGPESATPWPEQDPGGIGRSGMGAISGVLGNCVANRVVSKVKLPFAAGSVEYAESRPKFGDFHLIVCSGLGMASRFDF